MRYFLFLLLFISEFSKAEKIPTSGTLLWRISGNGLINNSYLYGTMHTRDSRAFYFSDSVLNCFMRCNLFTLEIELNAFNQEKVLSQMILDSGQTLANYLSKTQFDSVQNKIAESTGLSTSLFNQLKPIYLATLLYQNAVHTDSTFTNSSTFFLDEYFNMLALHANKKVIALESLHTQLNVFNFLSISNQVDLLMKVVRNNNIKSDVDTFIQHYIKGDLEILINQKETDLWPADFVSQILYKRNFGIAEKIESLIYSTSTFSAFGAAHLTGDSGVITLLRNKGFTVAPVHATHNNINADGWLYVYPNENIDIAMPGLPILFADTLSTKKIVYQKWVSSKTNNYVIAKFDKSCSVNKKLLANFAVTEIKSTVKLSREENDFEFENNIKIYTPNNKINKCYFFIIECADEKMVALIFNEQIIDLVEMKKVLSGIRYNKSSGKSYYL